MRRWKISQMGVSCVHPDLSHLVDELKEMDKEGLHNDTFEITILDIPDEEYQKLPEFKGY